VGYCSPTLATDGERVFAIVATGEINAFTLDGKPAWPGNLGAPKIQYGYGSSLLVMPGRVVVQCDDEKGGRLVGLDSKTGKKVWDKARAGAKTSWASPVLATAGTKKQILVCGDPFAMGHDAASGEALWRVNWTEEAAVEVAPSPAYANGIAYFTVNRAALVAVKLGEDKALWKYTEGGLPDVSSPVATEKYVLLAADDGLVTCLDAPTGKKLWTHEFDLGFDSSPVIAGDRVYLVDKKGFTSVVKLGDQFELLAKNALGEETGCTPAIPKGRIYLRTRKNLYCIGKD
jgi:outer membrane protein assembly factor BamB